ncbi:hypothetical protein LTR72_010921 [Exophiala xenobiotica]|nr:hypothetical protein LTR72_010921 [Exophiala xenobiotica]KAK5285502.1 hypothetical protein LTR14_010898 [Exophiala xenobiotica]KAK5367105.1 hypothetical protein LTS13_007958 [Exophiala xenobiotica]KAK5401366.1 hypothetical protein LTR79_001885 [Exophiala xenobiotica]KAK5406990.1 hypothetical protein LTR90_010247 [Exophiala xenobiotica]
MNLRTLGGMEDDLRSFQSVSIGLTSVESGKERFTRDGLYQPPPLAYWRNNLTALSQHYNLYFVANRDSIAVYRPEFPFQKLHRLPSLLIPPTLAQSQAEGYMDTYFPHTINHMIVGDLGSEEIVLVGTDSGNVTAYFTKAIDEAIRRDPYRFSTNARSDYVGVRAFFTQWVYESAWGLSIHSKARMIAVSANTTRHVRSDDPCSKITVFAFALTEQSDSHGHPQDDHDSIDIADHAKQPDWEEWQCKGRDPAPPPRNKNYKITLGGFEGHNYNIPSISFVNTDDDNDGRWLLSTDIGGEMKMWLIWQGFCVKTWDFAETRMRSGFFRRREGGWIVAALDPKAFRLARSMEQFCGHSKMTKYAGNVGESYDLTNIVRLRTPGNSLAHPHINGALLADAADEDPQETYDSWSDLGESDDGNVDSNAIRSGRNDGAEQAREPAAPADQANEADTDVEMADSMTANHSYVTSNDAESVAESEEADSDSVQALLFDTEQSEPDDDDEEQEEEEDAEGHYESSSEEQEGQSFSSSHRTATTQSSLAQRNSEGAEDLGLSDPNANPPTYVQHPSEPAISSWMRKAAYRLFRSAATRSEVPSIPTLHCTASNLRLLMAPESSAAHVFCANILKQALPENIEMTNHVHLDRINMFQQIPELGIVIIASQIGRCAICTTTRNEKTGTLGLRVDWILPSRKQELRHVRPYMPLLGIATSPVQGRFVGHSHKGRMDPEASNEWGSDGVVDGVSTTFDPAVVVVSDDELEHDCASSGETQPAIDEYMVEKSMKTSRLSTNSPSTSSAATSQTREWKKPKRIEPWIACENSRRYRLMLTYLDMTVLTYEISRAVEKEDVAQDEVSALESVD